MLSPRPRDLLTQTIVSKLLVVSCGSALCLRGQAARRAHLKFAISAGRRVASAVAGIDQPVRLACGRRRFRRRTWRAAAARERRCVSQTRIARAPRATRTSAVSARARARTRGETSARHAVAVQPAAGADTGRATSWPRRSPSRSLLAARPEADELERYAQRDARSQRAKAFRGGDAIVISVGTMLMILLIVLLVVLLLR